MSPFWEKIRAVTPWLTVVVIAHFGDWRWAGWLYGVAGIFFAAFFWKIFREHPKDHPATNEAERALLAVGRPTEESGKGDRTYKFPWRIALTHRSL